MSAIATIAVAAIVISIWGYCAWQLWRARGTYFAPPQDDQFADLSRAMDEFKAAITRELEPPLRKLATAINDLLRRADQ